MVNVKPKKRRSNYKKRNYTRPSARKMSKMFVKKVQSIVNKNLETKTSYRTEYGSGVNCAITSATDAFQLVPNMLQGLTDSSRIADQIRGQSLIIRGHFNTALAYTTASGCRLGVRMMIVQPKQYGNFAQVQANAALWLQYLLKKGGTTTAFTGITPDLYADINRDAITCYYDKKFYINTPYLQTAVGDTTIANSVKFFTKKIILKNKLIRYDANVDGGLTPVNYCPVLLIGYVKLDGSAPDANVQLSLNYDAYLNFQDA